MEIPAWLFFSCLALISTTFLHLGFYALDKTDLSNSVSPVVMSFFKHYLAISSCSSSSYALVFRPQLKLAVERRYLWVAIGVIPSLFYAGIMNISFVYGSVLLFLLWFFAWLFHSLLPELKIFADRYALIISVMFISSALFSWYFLISVVINFHLINLGENSLTRVEKTGIAIHMAIESTLFLVSSSENANFFPILVLFVSFLVSASWAAISGHELFAGVSSDPSLWDEEFRKLLAVAEKGKEIFSAFKGKKSGKMIGFAVGMGATVLFQSFFRLTAFDHVVAFLYLAVAWMTNLALLGVSGDFGIFNFLLGNVIVGCTVGQFGLRGTTWLAYSACLLLFGLRLKLESLTLVYRENRQTQVSI